MPKEKMKGIFVALLTPFDEQGKINAKALEALIEMNLRKGVSGFYVGGSTAEAFMMTEEERERLLELVQSIVNGRATVIAHIGSIATEQAIRLAEHAARQGVDAISSVTPFYYKFSFAEIKQYYFDIVSQVDKPMLIYNFPAFSGVSLTEENIDEFLNDHRFIGVKHTSNDFFALERFKAKHPEKIFYNGFDEMFLSGLAMGADGGVGSTYNFMAEKFVRMYALCRENRFEEARPIQAEVNHIIKALLRVGVFAGEKAMLELMGIDFGKCRRPFQSATTEQKRFLEKEVLPLVELP